MEREYRERYGVEGTVLYPSRGSDCPLFSVVPLHVRDKLQTPRVAYAGSLYGAISERPLQLMAQALFNNNGRLLIYGYDETSRSKMPLLNFPNVEFRGRIPSRQLIEALRCEADFLYLPMSFEPSMRTHMRLSFPSKLADYTAVGLPIIVHGPSDCSGVQWANEYPRAALAVTENTIGALSRVICLLLSNSNLRERLGQGALQVGSEFFSVSTACRVFFGALRNQAARWTP
jgi:glycosyltransferase involved in cell wall biosynthesis